MRCKSPIENLSARLARLIITAGILFVFLATTAPQRVGAGVIVETNLSFDSLGSGTQNYLSDVYLVYYYNDQLSFPSILIDPISHNNSHLAAISLNVPFYFASGYSSFDNASAYVSYAVFGVYHDVDNGADPSFFSTFSNLSFAEGQSFDNVFNGFDPYAYHSEAEVIGALIDPGGGTNSENSQTLLYLIGFILNNPDISSLVGTPTQQGQTATLVHFSDGTAFGQGSSTASRFNVVPEPASLVLVSSALLALGFVRTPRR